MAKKKTIAGLVDEAAVILQRIVRKKAADENGYCKCVTCGKVDHWKKMHGGHFIPRGHTIHKLLEENIHPQCVSCNTFRAESAKVNYWIYMADTYGEDFVRELVHTKNDVCKYTRPEIMEKIAELKEYEKGLAHD